MLPSEFQDTAERLARGVTEGDWRSAISRAYYGVFHYFREFFLAHGLDIGQGGVSHNSLYVGLHNCGIPSVADIGTRVDDLRSTRTRADYNLKARISSAIADAAVLEGRQLVADFRALLTTVPAPSIVDGARQHLRSIGRIP